MVVSKSSPNNIFARYLSVIAIVAILISPIDVIAKQGYTALKTKNGVLIAWNDSKAYFTVELPGTEFKHVAMEGLTFLVDGNLVQIITVKPTLFSKSKDTPDIVLKKHRDWERKHWEKLLKQGVTTKLINNNANSYPAVSLWQITWPEGASKRLKTNARRNLWATRVVGNRVVTISVPVMKDANESEVLKLFHTISRTFKSYSKPVDPIKIQAKLRK